MVKDRILAAVPSRSSTFLIEQGAEKLDDMVKMEEHFFLCQQGYYFEWFDSSVKH